MMDRVAAGYESASKFETAIRVLKQIQFDYRCAIEQLQELSVALSAKEALANRQLDLVIEVLSQMGVNCGSSLGISTLHSAPELTDAEATDLYLVATPLIPTLEVYCLGTFSVRIGGKTVQYWQSSKAKAVLKYLVARRRRPVSKEALMEALWPDVEPQLANNNLRAAIRALRQTLGGCTGGGDFSWIQFQDGNYLISSEGAVWTDIEQFECHVNRGRQLEKEGCLESALREYELAEVLYRGDYLQDDLYEDWTLLEREALKDVYSVILGRLADCHMAISDYASSVRYCQQIIFSDCCREDAYRRLMTCYSRLGNRNRALEWYRICERTIQQELDLLPEHQTQVLCQRLLGNEIL
ncbi:MAG: BTAD domain-containing putative transcriptional regulator [Chloroflexota bacterium]|nr:BTAD domain-containing putative transcriptional regulator [Chloroflexota bacterium]